MERLAGFQCLSNLSASLQGTKYTDLKKETDKLCQGLVPDSSTWSIAMSKAGTSLMLDKPKTGDHTFTSLADTHTAMMRTLKSIHDLRRADGETPQDRTVNYLAEITRADPYETLWCETPVSNRTEFLVSCGLKIQEKQLEGTISPLLQQISATCLAHLWAHHDEPSVPTE